MVSTLSIWSSERGQGGRQDISWIMRPTVANLTPKQVQALAEYVSALR
jgi:cytochrome c553